MKIIITGAAGFLGQVLMQKLSRSGLEVIGWSRTHSSAKPVIEAVDYENETLLENKLDGIDGVIHLAGTAHVSESNPEIYKKSVFELTVRLWRAACKAKVKHFVYASSIKVYGDDLPGVLLRENTKCTPGTAYGTEKKNAEEFLLKEMQKGNGPRLTILRLPPVYGIASKGVVRYLIMAARWRLPLPIHSLSAKRSFLSADNAAKFIEAALYKKLPEGVINPIESQPLTIGEFYRDIYIGVNEKWPKLYGLKFPARLLTKALRVLGMENAIQTLQMTSEHETEIRSLQLKPSGFLKDE